MIELVKYTFFYKGPFSQWYKRDFEIAGIVYNCAEKYMMAIKASAFNDMETYHQIMEAEHPWDHKALGRLVKGYNDQVWHAQRMMVVKAANMAKFSQHEDLKKKLLDTAGTVLVEASPTDRIWGIGLGMDDNRRFDERLWRGQNLLGKALTSVRDELIKKEQTHE